MDALILVQREPNVSLVSVNVPVRLSWSVVNAREDVRFN